MSQAAPAFQYSLREIADFLRAELVNGEGADAIQIHGLAPLASAGPGQLTFLSRGDFARHLPACQAAAVIVNRHAALDLPMPALLVDNAYLAYARASALFDDRPKAPCTVHPSASVDPDAVLGDSVTVGPQAVIEAGVRIGAGSVIGPGCVIGAHSVLGEGCLLHARVTLYHRVTLGNRVVLHSGVVLGADGFGFAPLKGMEGHEGGWQKIHQLGRVRVGHRVEIGANSTVDRGALEDTVIADGVIIDNQVQIAHNVQIGENTAIAACTGIAGSTVIGANCTIAGAVGIVGHLHIVDNVHITAMTLVTGSIDQPGSYSSGTNLLPTRDWRRQAVRFGQLDDLARRVRRLEKD